MRRSVFPRILIITLAYAAVFILLVSVQFARRGSFTRKVGGFVVSGQYLETEEGAPPVSPDEYYLHGDAHVFFGGMDFCLVKSDDGPSLHFENTDGNSTEALPDRMVLSGDSALFSFQDGSELLFSVQTVGASPEMRISGSFPENIAAVEIPFKPQRKTELRDNGNGQLLAVSGGIGYSFGLSQVDAERMTLRLSAGGTVLSYKALTESGTFSPGDFILPQAAAADAYGEFITRWRDENFSLWNRMVSRRNDEDVVVALEAEALARGTYKAATAEVPASFLRGTARTYESSSYLGGLGEAYRSLASGDQEKLVRLSRLINEESLEFLFEPNVIEYFAARGHFNLIDAGEELVRTIDPSVLSLDIIPGILEGYTDWPVYRPGAENPFERLTDQACFVISESLRQIAAVPGASDSFGNRVFVFNENYCATEFNLRLGKALMIYAETVQDESWAGVGRSIILSVLSLTDDSGMAAAGFSLSAEGAVEPAVPSRDAAGAGAQSPAEQVSGARFYRALNPLDACPRALPIETQPNHIWTWTAANTVSAARQSDHLDISVSFPAGETHFMILRGIRPFTKIQLYNMDFRSDPQFERYDSSGWSYIAAEQTLIVKMKHRTNVEHIRIFYREAPRTPPQAAPAQAAPAATSAAPAAAAPVAPVQTAVTPAESAGAEDSLAP